MTQPRAKRRLWWEVVRLSITLGAFAYVVSQITWMDRLRLDDGSEVWGWSQEEADGANVLLTDQQGRFPIPPPNLDRFAAHPFTPGFFTLLRGVNVGLFFATVVLFPISYVLLAVRWQWLMHTHGLQLGIFEAVRLTWIGILTNNVLPGSTGGDFVKAVCIYRRYPEKRMPAVMTVFMDRVLGLVSLMLVGAIAILLQSNRPELAGAARFVEWVLLIVFVGGCVYFSGRIRKLARVGLILDRLPFRDHIRKVDESMFHYRRHTWVMAGCVGLSLIIHLYSIGCIYFLGVSLGLRVHPLNYFIFLPIIFTAGAVLPSIAGLGVLEGLFQQFFSMPGIGATPSSALALCILYRIMILLGSLPGAVPTYHEFSRQRHAAVLEEKSAAISPVASRATS